MRSEWEQNTQCSPSRAPTVRPQAGQGVSALRSSGGIVTVETAPQWGQERRHSLNNMAGL